MNIIFQVNERFTNESFLLNSNIFIFCKSLEDIPQRGTIEGYPSTPEKLDYFDEPTEGCGVG